MSSETGFIFGEDRRPDRGPLYDYWGTRRSCRSAEPAESQYGHYESATRWLSRQFAGVLSFMLAMFAGLAMSNSTMVQAVDVGGREAMIMNPPDAAFGWAIGIGVVGMLLLAYATGGRS